MSGTGLDQQAAALKARSNLGMAEFIALGGALSAVPAMSIDIMLPVLPAIGRAFDIVESNQRQLVVIVFALSFSGMQLFFGPISDRFGRKPLLIFGLCLYVLASAGAVFTTDFYWFLSFRILQGVAAAPMSVVTMAMIRDCFAGQAMGRVLTFVFTVFMIVPIVAPLIGQGIAFLTGWQGIFIFNLLVAAALLVWLLVRLGETLKPEARRPLDVASLGQALMEIVTNRITLGYMIVSMLTMVALFSYIALGQQVYGELYGLGEWFTAAFGATSVGVALAALTSARLVRRFGMRPVAHLCMALFAVSGMALFLMSLVANPPFPVTFALLAICMMCFGVMQGNINAIALEPLGHIAGTAASIYSVLATTSGVFFGGLVGQSYAGTVTPLAFAFGVLGTIAVAVVFITERGRMFRNSTSISSHA